MPRLTFTLDEEIDAKLESLRASAGSVAERVGRVADKSRPDSRWELVDELASSVARLGDDPSLAALVREALFYYLASLDEIERSARLEAGYAELAKDEEREQVMEALAYEAAEAWADEP